MEGLPQALSDPQTRSTLMELMERVEEYEGDVERLLDEAAPAEAEREQNRDIAQDARSVAGRNEAKLNRLESQLHYGKGKRKQLILYEAENRASERENGKGRILVKEAVEFLAGYKEVSRRTARTYLRELADDYEGVYYRQAREPKYKGRNVKALYFYDDEFWSHHDTDDLLER